MSTPRGIVRALALRSGDHQPMIEVFDAVARKGRGLEGDDRAMGKRGLTLLSTERWVEVIDALGTVLPWHTRRANVLVEGLDLGEMIGRRMRVGGCNLHVWGETKPCGEMDELFPGLRAVLKTDFRAGVYGEVLSGGPIRIGDEVRPLAHDGPPTK